MHGSGKEEIEFQYMNDRGDVVIRKHPFEGILNNMARRYKETESMSVREELAKNISNRPCADCDGSRLRPEARNVYIGPTNLPMISEKALVKPSNFLPHFH
ncbi:UvrABC system protein A [Rodentibacter pneumotropicus]|uniref:UvrABC system protein A n=1 Tax=Rodentibacter pneumotropicus TaxID=758 RepID=A0A448MTC1_9PAST|nr:UvrABC system protein A [Rodentibacter pneumotropicus]